jgi:rubredoxin
MGNQQDSSKKKRNMAILGALVLVLLGILIYRFAGNSNEVKEGARIVVVCEACKARMIKRIVNIKNDSDKRNYCDKCGGRLVALWKCNECQFEFPEQPLPTHKKKFKNKVELYDTVMKSMKCPNCGSILSHPVSIKEFNDDLGKK